MASVDGWLLLIASGWERLETRLWRSLPGWASSPAQVDVWLGRLVPTSEQRQVGAQRGSSLPAMACG